MEGLKKARDARRKAPKARNKKVVPKTTTTTKIKPKPDPPKSTQLGLPKLAPGTIEQMSARIQKYAKMAEKEPGILTASIIAHLLADIEDVNKALTKIWAWVNRFLDNPDNDPSEIVKLLEVVRKWTETYQTAALKVAEIQAKVLVEAPGETDPMDAYRNNRGTSVPSEQTALVQVTEDENA